MKDVIIWGITGQIAGYIADDLLNLGYKVYGIKRRASTDTMWRIKHLLENKNFNIIEGDITDNFSVNSITNNIKPYAIINTSAQSHVHSSFEQPAYTFNVNANGVLNILESIRNLSPTTRFLQFSTSELFGSNYDVINGEKIQTENTKFSPNSPYAVSKLAAYHLVQLYRKSYNIFACNNINFNTESPKRGEEFVTKKITKWIGEFYNWFTSHMNVFECSPSVQYKNDFGYPLHFEEEYICYNGHKFPKLRLGNLKTYRDWSHAKDISKGVILAVNYSVPDDYIFCSGKTYTIEDFCKKAFKIIGIKNWEDYVCTDQQFYRPCDVEYLRGSFEKANKTFGWEPTITLDELIKEMVRFDIEKASKK